MARKNLKKKLHEIIGEVVDLKRKGFLDNPYWIGLCPFHDDHNPSFVVYPTRYKCFSCGASGDAIQFYRDHYGMSFTEAKAKALEDMDPLDELLDKMGGSLVLSDYDPARDVYKLREKFATTPFREWVHSYCDYWDLVNQHYYDEAKVVVESL